MPTDHILTRREWLRRMSAAAALPVVGGWLPPDLLEWGREAHAAARAQADAPGFVPDLLRVLSSACDRVIPSDETPGALAAGVPRFIDHMLAVWYDPPERPRVAQGLEALDREARARFGRAFSECAGEQQDVLLLELDARGRDSWFGTVKYLTIWGYYTSEIGITQELQHNLLPGRYDGCAPYAPRKRAAAAGHIPEPPVGTSHDAG